MRTYVLDCSALMRVLLGDGPVPTEILEAMTEVSHGESVLLAPDLLLAEAAQVVRKLVGRDILRVEEAEQLLSDILEMPIRIVPHRSLLPLALVRAVQTGLTAYDALYLELALGHGAHLLTCDERLERAARRG